MKRFTSISLMLAVLCFTLFASMPLSAQEWSAAQKEVWKTVETMWDLFAKGDIEGELAYTDEELAIWLQNSPLPIGKAEFRKWVALDVASAGKTLMQELKPVTIKVFPEFAFVHYYVTSVYQQAPAVMPEYGTLRITDIFIKKGGKWMWIGGHNSNVPQK